VPTIEPGDIDEAVPPSGEGCAECAADGGWWLHLRRCATCGHVGCCDNSPAQHATHHQQETGHEVIQSFEPGEDWFYDYRSGEFFEGPTLAPPDAHPLGQGVPGPQDRVPEDWQTKLHP
jgi:hypothetical protein